MKYKLFISDYDGTLGVAPKNDIDPETLEAIRAFQNKGGIFAVCSGRETSSITRICRESGLKGIVASFQGARISDIESGKYLFEGGLDAETALKVLSDVEGNGLIPLAYSGDGFFYDEFNPYIERYEKAIRLKGRVGNVKEIIAKENLRTSKICWLGPDDVVNRLAEEMNKKHAGMNIKENITKQKLMSNKICWLGPDDVVNRVADDMNTKYLTANVKFNSGAKCLLEAINPNCGKGQAVKFIADYYGIPLDQVITVGDSTNDIDLLVGPWHGVAVGDGREELKAVADEITVPFKDKPVKTLLEKYCLKE